MNTPLGLFIVIHRHNRITRGSHTPLGKRPGVCLGRNVARLSSTNRNVGISDIFISHLQVRKPCGPCRNLVGATKRSGGNQATGGVLGRWLHEVVGGFLQSEGSSSEFETAGAGIDAALGQGGYDATSHSWEGEHDKSARRTQDHESPTRDSPSEGPKINPGISGSRRLRQFLRIGFELHH